MASLYVFFKNDFESIGHASCTLIDVDGSEFDIMKNHLLHVKVDTLN